MLGAEGKRNEELLLNSDRHLKLIKNKTTKKKTLRPKHGKKKNSDRVSVLQDDMSSVGICDEVAQSCECI